MLPTLTGLAHNPSTSSLNPWIQATAIQSKLHGAAPSLLPLRQRNGACLRLGQQAKVGNMAASAFPVPSSGALFSIPPPVDSGRPGTVLEILEQLQESRGDGEELMKKLAVSEEERPKVRYDEWTEMGEIPVIDLSLAETDRVGTVKQLYNAAAEWGFFQLVNHGLTVDELGAVQSEGLKFFNLPAEIKQNLGSMGPEGRCYIGDNTHEKGSALHWAESLMFAPDNVDQTISKIWPDGNSEFRNAVITFFKRAKFINEQLHELLAEGLGLSTDLFSQHLDSKRARLRWNFYPACPRPSDVLGASSHTDGCSITLLIQDKVGGLQIQKDGDWIGIKPIEGALVVNVGDILHAWTNGIFKSVLHRVVVNESVHRFSLAAFMNVDKDLSITAPEELVDDNHPRLYRPFTHGDYATHVVATRYRDQSMSASKDGLFLLDGFKIQK
ncbi:unnamed protein product [Calypogeia fissa]